ncbi:MAG: hypothetical protein GXP54_10315 [Deltaproteobacteria bacterium]|nr:hypothetical protein [Deltaproteobacteria bacterium]
MSEETFHYVEEVEEFFVATIRKGLMLRSSDVDVVRDWQSRNVPVDVVRKGILDGVRAFLQSADPGQALPSILKYYRTYVEKAFETHQRAMERGLVFDHDGAENDKAADLVRHAVNVLTECAAKGRDTWRASVYSRAIERLEATVAEKGVIAGLEHIERDVVQSLIDSAPDEVSSRIHAAIDAKLAQARSRGLGKAAMEDVKGAELMKAAENEFAFPGLVDIMVKIPADDG